MNDDYDGLIADFETRHGVTVDLQTVPADQYSDLLQSRLTTHTVTDIFWIQSNPFAIQSVIGEPEKYLMDFTGEAWVDVIPPERLSACSFDDKVYGLMLWHNSPEYVMVYNRSLFAEHDITDVPRSYNELKTICATLHQNDIIPWFVPGADGWQHQLSFFQIGPVYEQADPGLYERLNTNQATFADNEKMLEVLEQFKELSDLGYFGEDWIGSGSSNMVNLFADREIAMALAGPGYINQIKSETDSQDDYGIFLIPLGDNQNYPTNPAGPIMMAYRESENPELVRAFYDYLVEPANLQTLLDAHESWTNLAVNEAVVSIEQHWLPIEKELIDNVTEVQRQTPVLQTGTRYTNDHWMTFGQDLVAYCLGQMEANEVLANMDKARAESAKLEGNADWN